MMIFKYVPCRQAAISSAAPALDGYLSAYHIDHIERLEAHNTTEACPRPAPCPPVPLTPTCWAPTPEVGCPANPVPHLPQVWAPYYTLHKIMAGLFDIHRVGFFTGSSVPPVWPYWH